MSALICVLALLASACDGHQSLTGPAPVAAVAPLPQLPPLSTRLVRLALAGQSNAVIGRPVFDAQTSILTMVDTAGDAGSMPIACWAAGASCVGSVNGFDVSAGWIPLVPTLQRIPIDAFVWWQGESDVTNAGYGVALADLVARVRVAVGDPQLLVVLMQYGPAYRDQAGGSVTQSVDWVQHDAHALYVHTADLEYRTDGAHMTDAGYAAAAQRIVTMVRQKLTTP